MVTLSLGWNRGSLVLWTVGPGDFHRDPREGSEPGHVYIPRAYFFLMGIPLWIFSYSLMKLRTAPKLLTS